jgi:hypothetical protein
LLGNGTQKHVFPQQRIFTKAYPWQQTE